jgi:hypothetical protein
MRLRGCFDNSTEWLATFCNPSGSFRALQNLVFYFKILNFKILKMCILHVVAFALSGSGNRTVWIYF